MSASLHRYSCDRLGICQHRNPPCSKSCDQDQELDADVDALLRAQGCQIEVERFLAKLVILVLGVALGGVLGLIFATRFLP